MLVKIFLTPLLILMCLLVARRWGSFVGGVIAGLPLISGPVSFFLTLEQGAAFSAAASFNTLLGVLACTITALVYPWLAAWGLPWFVALPAALCGFFGGGWAVLHLPFTHLWAVALSSLSPVLVLTCLPRVVARCKHGHALSAGVRVPMQMACGAGLVFAVTEGAHWLGPGWSGVLMFFPVMVCSIVPFAHATLGAGAVISIFRGIMAGWFGCIVFAVVVMTGVEHLSLWLCYGLASGAALLASALVSLLEQRAQQRHAAGTEAGS